MGRKKNNYCTKGVKVDRNIPWIFHSMLNIKNTLVIRQSKEKTRLEWTL